MLQSLGSQRATEGLNNNKEGRGMRRKGEGRENKEKRCPQIDTFCPCSPFLLVRSICPNCRQFSFLLSQQLAVEPLTCPLISKPVFFFLKNKFPTLTSNYVIKFE